ncbi:LAMI_0D13036g1_1 [Lachancea mirantina]|uniref:LAMI_0D13036g1_1 n=1 Tax=Lachancea mirantina TaxID=1230905 RepID=A0A1G4JG42_9SACH|nr:LAMI_0D13036g1_1 [Lachancea mirantina]
MQVALDYDRKSEARRLRALSSIPLNKAHSLDRPRHNKFFTSDRKADVRQGMRQELNASHRADKGQHRNRKPVLALPTVKVETPAKSSFGADITTMSPISEEPPDDAFAFDWLQENDFPAYPCSAPITETLLNHETPKKAPVATHLLTPLSLASLAIIIIVSNTFRLLAKWFKNHLFTLLRTLTYRGKTHHYQHAKKTVQVSTSATSKSVPRKLARLFVSQRYNFVINHPIQASFLLLLTFSLPPPLLIFFITMSAASIVLSVFYIAVLFAVGAAASALIVPFMGLSLFFGSGVMICGFFSNGFFKLARATYQLSIAYTQHFLRSFADQIPPSVGVAETPMPKFGPLSKFFSSYTDNGAKMIPGRPVFLTGASIPDQQLGLHSNSAQYLPTSSGIAYIAI